MGQVLTPPGGCPANPALGKSVNVDFTSGASSEFTSFGDPTYGSNGAAFTIAKSGDSPSISSKWYIMFGHVDFVIQAAPGTGIVSAAVLQSDCLDEIDWEWLGGDDAQVQSNYFGKGLTTTGYNRGAFHSAPGNHDGFHTYSVDWTADQIVWSVDGVTVRALTQADAEAGQYPQTPMIVKVGAWAGGDSSNPQGTIEWAGGPTDYSAGPYTMYLKSISVTDYSTGSQYSYSGTSGTWESIVSTGGQINSDGSGTPGSSNTSPTATSTAPAITSHVSEGAPLAFGNNDSTESATRTGWPWAGTASTTAVNVVSESISGLTSQCPPCSSSVEVLALTFWQTLTPSLSSSLVLSSASVSASSLEVASSTTSLTTSNAAISTRTLGTSTSTPTSERASTSQPTSQGQSTTDTPGLQPSTTLVTSSPSSGVVPSTTPISPTGTPPAVNQASRECFLPRLVTLLSLAAAMFFL